MFKNISKLKLSLFKINIYLLILIKMNTIINIPYLTSGRQINQRENSENIENTKHGKLEINNPKRLDNILKKREKYLNLSGGFREAFNYNTFPKNSD